MLHLLALAEASTLARVACTSRALAVLVPVAIEQRAKLLGQRLMPRAGEVTRLLSLRFAERLVARPAVTLAGDTCHTLCIDCDGRAWAWGGHELGPVADEEHDVEPDADEQDSAAGQRKWLLHLGLGRDAGPDVLRPERVALEPSAGLRVLDVAAGYEHSLLRCADGFVYSFGVGAHGRLGHGLASTATPRRVEAIEHVAQVAAGGFQSLAVTDSGHAYSWGWGESGSTGHGERHHHVVPKLITALAHLRIVQASAGSGHSLFLSDAGVVFACGDHRRACRAPTSHAVRARVRQLAPPPSRAHTPRPMRLPLNSSPFRANNALPARSQWASSGSGAATRWLTCSRPPP